jgi:peptide/nickel transport system permease protein
MLQYIVRRLISTIPVLLGVCLITFILLNVVPGDPVAAMMGKRADPAVVERIRDQLGLNDPIWKQFVRFVGNALRGDLGESFRNKIPVSESIGRYFPVTIKLAVFAITVAILIGVPIGIISAVRQYSWLDHASMVVALGFISAPIFWVATICQLIFGLRLGWLPISGYGGFIYMLMPALILGSRFSASLARLTRSSLLEVVRQDYIRTGRAKGLAENVVVFKHALKNAMIPVITVIGMQIGGLLTGSFFTETVFGIPGLGRFTIQGINDRDFPVIQGTVLFTAVIFVLSNLIVDISYAYLDPRIRLE